MLYTPSAQRLDPFLTNHPVGNRVHKNDTIKFDVVGDPLQCISNSCEHTKKRRKITSSQNTAHTF